MRLGKPSFPVTLTAEEVITQVEGLLKKNNWLEFKIDKPSLVFFPYWFFHFDAFNETVDPETKEKTTSEGEKGTSSMDAIDGELNDNVATLFDSYSDQLQVKPEAEHARVERSHFKADEVQKLVQLKMAARLNLDKEDVVISGVRLVYFPVYVCSAVFEENEMDFEIDAVEGNLLSEEEVPYKGKTASELARETLFDLSTPINWIKYLIDLIKGLLLFLWTNPLSEQFRFRFKTDRNFQLVVLIAVLVLIALNQWIYHWA